MEEGGVRAGSREIEEGDGVSPGQIASASILQEPLFISVGSRAASVAITIPLLSRLLKELPCFNLSAINNLRRAQHNPHPPCSLPGTAIHHPHQPIPTPSTLSSVYRSLADGEICSNMQKKAAEASARMRGCGVAGATGGDCIRSR
ncbi:hypothetical protein AOLI_G00175220 [Acnodon oligacanthus]